MSRKVSTIPIRGWVLGLIGFVVFALLFVLAAIAGGSAPGWVVAVVALCLVGAAYLSFKLRKLFHR